MIWVAKVGSLFVVEHEVKATESVGALANDIQR
ncbi:MAG: hypothetical protein BWX48_03698 [Verrucomicrobia bacterium ADurb.Bin006]|jgi:hypothetical protein|nr:MAG: hypothetical protein BWX48_03698 [Verrucomicrobia bacterium ADurb.Bin006]